MSTVFRHLGLDMDRLGSWVNLGEVHSHTSRSEYYEEFPPRARKLLNTLLLDGVRDVEQLLQRNFSHWQIHQTDWQ